jgi:hypothetical protein
MFEATSWILQKAEEAKYFCVSIQEDSLVGFGQELVFQQPHGCFRSPSSQSTTESLDS